MKIRNAEFYDIEVIAAMGELMAAESPVYSKSHYSYDKVKDTFAYLINHPEEGIIFVVEDDEGRLIGGFVGVITTDWFGEDKNASDLAMFVLPEHRNGTLGIKLIKHYIEEARARNVKNIKIGNTTDVRAQDIWRLYERMGFHQVGANFILGE